MSVAAAARTFLSSRPGHSDDLMDTTGSDISESSSLSSGLASMPRQSSISNGLGSIGRASLSMRSPSLAARSGSGGARGSSSLPAGALSEFMNAPDYAESEPSRDGSEKGCGVVTNILSRSLGRSELALCLLAEVTPTCPRILFRCPAWLLGIEADSGKARCIACGVVATRLHDFLRCNLSWDRRAAGGL